MTDQKRAWWVPIVASTITSLAVLAGAWFTFKSDVVTSNLNADASRLETAFKRIEYLENRVNEQKAVSTGKIVELTGQVFQLQSQLNEELNIMDMFEQFMDSLPFEAWLKGVSYDKDDEPVFEMLLINDRYEFNYNISQRKYEGATDADIWGQVIATRFRENDIKVLSTKSSLVTYENFPSDSSRRSEDITEVRRLIVKVYLELVDGKGMIFGMAIDPADIVTTDK